MTGTLPNPTRIALDFVLPDHRGDEFHLGSHLEAGPVVLVFYRGHWCPYCRRYLCKLVARSADFEKAGAEIAAVSAEPVAISRVLAQQLGVEFALLSDRAGRVIDAYGVRNGFSGARTLLPHPAVFVIAPGGSVRFQSIDRNYKKRTTIRTILGVLDELASTRGES